MSKKVYWVAAVVGLGAAGVAIGQGPILDKVAGPIANKMFECGMIP